MTKAGERLIQSARQAHSIATRLPKKFAATTAALQASTPKPNKYRAKKKSVDGITFHSTKEADRYEQLKTMQRIGLITDLEIQPKFVFEFEGQKVLIRSKGYPNGRQATYKADFRYFDIEKARVVIEDVKSKITRERDGAGNLRRALVECMTGIRVDEV